VLCRSGGTPDVPRDAIARRRFFVRVRLTILPVVSRLAPLIGGASTVAAEN